METTIKYDIYSLGKDSLIIYNIRSKKVSALVNEYNYQERFARFWDGLKDNTKRVAAGIYFYTLKTNGTSIVKRLVYLGNLKN